MKKKKFSEFLKENEDAFEQQHNSDMQSLQNQNIQWTDTGVNNNNGTSFLDSLNDFFSYNNSKNEYGQGANNSIFQKRAFNDGYQFGDISATIVGTGINAFDNAVKGVSRLGEGISDFAVNRIADVTELAGNKERANIMRANALKDDTDTNIVSKNIQNLTDGTTVLGEKGQNFVQQLSNTAFQATIGAGGGMIGGKVGATLLANGSMFLSSAGNSETEALNEQYSKAVQEGYNEGITNYLNSEEGKKAKTYSKIYGNLAGAIEVGTEAMFGGLGKITNAVGFGTSGTGLDDKLAKGLASKVSSTLAKNLIEFGVKAGSESIEELVGGIGDAIAQKLTYKQGEGLKDLIKDQNIPEAMLSAFVSSAIMQAPGMYSTTKNGQDFMSGLNQQDSQTYENLLENEQKQLIKSKAISDEYNKQIKGEDFTEAQKAQILEKITQDYDNGYLTSTKLSNDEIEQTENTAMSMLEEIKRIELNQSNPQQVNNKQSIEETNQVVPAQDNNQVQMLQLEPSGNERINEFRQSANEAELQENEKTRNLIDTAEGIISRTDNISIKFNNNIETNTNQVADGKVSVKDGQIAIEINPNSEKAMEYLMTHELIHPYITNDMRTMIETFSKNKNNSLFNDAIKEAQQKYNTTDITDEVVADAGAQLFGNQEFLNNVATEKPGMLKQIYNTIVSILNRVTGYSNEKLMLQDFKAKIEKAIKNNDITMENGSENYLIAGKKGLDNSLQEISSSNKIYQKLKELYDSYDRALEMKANKASNKKMMKETGGWFQDKNGDLKFEFPDTGIEFKQQLDIGVKYNLGDVIDHDILFTIYPEFKNYKIMVDEHLKEGTNASFSRKNNVIRISPKLTTKEAKGTILHEIQHAIQKSEGFESGASTGKYKSQKSYYESLGEAEADDVKQRYLNNSYEKLPISAKNNPRHRLYDEYMENRKTIDKLKDFIYTSSKGAMLNGQTSKKNNSEFQGLERKNGIQKVGRENLENSNKSSFSLQERLDGDDLLNAQDFIEELKSVGAEVDENGYVTVYHQTTQENADNIKKSGRMSAKEDAIFFSTSKCAQQSEGRGNTKLVFKIPVEELELDDIFDNNADVKIPLKNKNQTIDISNYIENNTKSIKEKQLDIINKNNRMEDDYHTGIRSIDDIKTFDEAIKDNESFVYGDYSLEDAKRDLENGKVIVYSSKPIEQGGFVSTSKNMARDYAGNGKIYSQEVPINDVAWINGDEGQYAKVQDNSKTKYSIPMSDKYNQFIEKTFDFGEKGTTTNSEDIKLPIQEKQLDTKQQDILQKARLAEKLSPNAKGIVSEFEGMFKNGQYSDEEYSQMKQMIDSMMQDTPLAETTYKESKLRQDNYRKYKNDRSSYDESAVDFALSTIKANRNDNRTVKQWNKVANTIGEQLAMNNKSIEDVEKIAYRSWYDLQPTKNITKYDNQAKQTVGFERLTLDDWLNSVYKSYKDNVQVEEQKQILPTQQKVENTQQEVNLPTAGEQIDYSQMERPTDDKKGRKFYKSVIESSNTTAEAKAIAKELMQQDTYVPDSNKAQLQRADKNIQATGVDTSLETLKGKISNGDRITATDIATSERLIEYYSKIGDKEKLQDAIQTSAMAGTEAGRTVQALSILNHSTPEGQVTWIQRSVDKMNDSLEKSHRKERFEFTPEMQQEILQADNMEEAVNNVYKQLGEQVPMSFLQKVDAWRYFSMLGNPRTHIRNIVGNKMMGFMQGAKNKLAGAIEDIVLSDSDDRQFTMARADKKTREFAKADTENVLDRLGLTENKYNPKSRIEQNQKVFKSDILNNTIGKLMNFNDSALEAEDGWGLKAMYPKALAQYLTANDIDVDHITDSQLAKARNFAIRQAEEATFHQDNAIASAISQFEGKNKLTRLATGAVLPFKKTPMNVAVEGIQYSPVGLVDSLTRGSIQLRKGDINVHQYIDGISKGLTGTGIALLGYALTEAGILKASGGDDEDKNDFEDAQGKQNYSIKIGDKTYSLDWLAPTGIPLFIGSELHQIANQKVLARGEKSETSAVAKEATRILNSMATAMNPLSEMSMISGLTNTLQSYASGNKGLENLGLNATKSYIGQFVPTALGQVAKTFDNKERSTTSTESDPFTKTVDSLKNQVKSKIPGLRQTLPTKTDIWGNDMNNTGNVLIKGLEAGVFPWTRKDITTNDTDKALTELYDKTQDSSVLPDSSISKTLSIDKDKYRLTNEQYAKYKKQYGQTSYNVLSGLTKSSEYKKMTDEEKVKAVSEVYKYAKAQIKSQYAKENDIDTEDNSVLRNVQSVAHYGGKAEDYFKYVGITTNAEDSKEKMKILENSNISTKSKEAIYSGVLGKNDELYPKVKSAIDVDSYLDFKSQKIENKTDLQEYLNDSDLDYNQKLLLYSTKYTMSNSEQSQLFDYINNLDLTSYEKIQIFSKLKGYKVKSNRITW